MGVLVAATLWFMVPEFQADTLDFCGGRDLRRWSAISQVRLYGQVRYGEGIPLLRSHAVRPGQRDSFVVQDDPPGWSYFVAAVDTAGREGCWAGITVGIPPVGVSESAAGAGLRLYDLAGRRVHPPLKSGVYFDSRRRIVVVR